MEKAEVREKRVRESKREKERVWKGQLKRGRESKGEKKREGDGE